jgi:hypothetical protein
MRHTPTLLGSLGIVLALSLAAPLGADDNFSGAFLFGFRFVDTSGPGAAFKYREDINLRAGARLTDFSLSYSPANGLRRVFDRLDIRAANFGGDPFETFTLGLQKSGKYTLQYDRKKASYFYQDLFLGDAAALYDLHTSDFDRVADSGLAKVWLGRNAELFVNFDRYTKKGTSTTSLDVERLVFEFEKPVEEDSKEIAVGLNVQFGRYGVVLEERILDYRNENSFFLPGFTDGGADAVWPTSLLYFHLNQPYDLKSYSHSFRFNGRPFNWLLLSGSAQLNQQDLDLEYSESAQGFDYLNRKILYDLNGTGTFDRDFQLYGLDASILLTRRLSLIGAVRYHNFNQAGTLTVGAESEAADFGYDTLGIDAGVQAELTSRLAATFGFRYEDRNLRNLETVLFDFDSDQNGVFGNIRWDLGRRLRLTLDYEHSLYNGPYTLISPTAYDRLRVTAKYQAQSWSLTGSYRWSENKSDIEEDLFTSTSNQLNLRGGYHGQRLKAFIGYAFIQSRREGDRTVTYPPYWTGPGGTFLWEIFYEGKSSLFDANLSVDLTANWKLGGYANYYTNRGSWRIDRSIVKAYLEYGFASGYIAQIGYRFVDFKEKIGGYNNYQANIVELSFGYRWQ